MTNKKYLPSVIVLYLNYFLHGIGCSILGQAVIKDALAASWNVEAMAITAIAAALGLGSLSPVLFRTSSAADSRQHSADSLMQYI